MKDIFRGLAPYLLKKRTRKNTIEFVSPMLATLTKKYFSSKDWIFEHKYDGERCIALKSNGKVSLISRNQKIKNAHYPELVQALQRQAADNFVIDGEIVATTGKFQSLQSRINLQNARAVIEQKIKTPIVYYIFDVMQAGGYDLRHLPLVVRKKILKKILRYNKVLIYSSYHSPDGLGYFRKACKQKWEGIIAKRAQSSYRGTRSRDWLKFKCAQGQELVIGGFTAPKGSRSDFGALLVGYYHKGVLHYAGKVGTGFDEASLRMLGKLLRKRIIQSCPFSNYTGHDNVTWVKPDLVAEFEFAEWTNSNKLRVPRYKGLRDDKIAKKVVKEIPR